MKHENSQGGAPIREPSEFGGSIRNVSAGMRARDRIGSYLRDSQLLIDLFRLLIALFRL
jgi:hypothetical protein